MTSFVALLWVEDDGQRPPALEAIRSRLSRLGPNGFAERKVGAGRLMQATLDFGDGRAAMAEPRTLDGRRWIVGEIRIDAKRDLVAALRQRGARVASGADDAELVLHAHAVWGEACAAHLQGEYAFAIWDAVEGRLFAVRDRLGARLLAFTPLAGGWMVANAMGPLIAHPDIDRSLDPSVIGDFLTAGYPTQPESSIFAAIRRAPPAHTLCIDEGGPRLQRYWSAPRPHIADRGASFADRVEAFDSVLAEAVRDRLQPGRMAIALSGGVDSTLVAALAAREAGGGGALTAHTLGYDWLISDTERYYAAAAARHLQMPHQCIAAEGATLAPPGGFWSLTPEPRFSLRRYPAHVLAADLKAEGIQTLFNGMGGDLLAVADRGYWADLAAAGKLGELGRGWLDYRRYFRRRPPLRMSFMHRWQARAATPTTLPSWLNPDFARSCDLEARFGDYRRRIARLDPRLQLAEDPYWSELLLGHTPEGGGVALRHASPLLDARVLEAALALPPAPFLHRKTILREVARPLLPNIIVRRGKAPLSEDPLLAAARLGIDPARAEIEATDALDDFVDRSQLLAKLDDLKQLKGRAYLDEIDRAAGLGVWLRAWWENAV